MKFFRFVGLVFTACIAAIGLWIAFTMFLAPLVLPPLSPVLFKPEGVPQDARIVPHWKDGNLWWHCRNVPSGHLWIGQRGRTAYSFQYFNVHFGSRCGNVNDREPVADVKNPRFIIGSETGTVSFAIYSLDPYSTQSPCASKMPATFYNRALIIVRELEASTDTILRKNRIRLNKAKESIVAMRERGMSSGGSSGATAYCGPKRA